MMKRKGIRIVLWWLLLSGSTICLGQEKEGNNDYQYALIEAVKQKNLGNISEAVKLYRLVIKEKPDCDVAYFELGTILLMTKQVDLATDNLEKAYLIYPDNQWYTLAYLNALGASEDYNKIIEILKEKKKKDPDDAEWEYQLATVYFTKGKAGKSIRILNRIEKTKGFSEKITLLKASIYESQEKYDLAKMEIEKVMNLFPEAIQFRIVAAELSMKNGKESEAADYYLEILEMDSTNIFALTNLTDYYRKNEDYKNSFKYLASSFNSTQIDVERKKAILSFYLSDKEFITKYPKELERLLQVFMEVHPDEPEGRLMAADFYIESRAYDKAYMQLKVFLEKNKGSYPLYMQSILLANAASMNEELIMMSNRALEQYPDSTDIRFFKGIGLYEEGEYELLVENFEGISFDEYSVKEYVSQSKMLYAEAFYRLEDYYRSDSLFEELITEEPDNYMVLNNYSFYLAERGAKLNKAREWSKMTIQNNPDNATFLDTYAWVLFKLKEYEEAEKYIMNAMEKGGMNDPEVNEHAGDIQVALESLEIAKSYYLKAIILGGDKDKLEGKIEGLKQVKDE
jgi:tetratricopeptide (TPR) repeat protein